MKPKPKTEDWKTLRVSLFRRIPLTPKMAIVVVVVGILVCSAADRIQSRVLKDILEEQFIERIGKRAIEDRMRFDQYIKAHYQSVKLFITQKEASVLNREGSHRGLKELCSTGACMQKIK